MSWSINLQGAPAALILKLREHADEIKDPQSSVEYKEALPVLESLVALNFGIDGRELRIVANGSGQGIHERICSVTLTEWDKLI